jgi:mannose/cellobiose epimerase-like protein (N-acyl-D-glucosamine 2-epimerase family)
MNHDLTDPGHREELRKLYRDTLLHDVMPFWLKHGMDREFDGIITSLDRDGSILDTDKSIWFQGRAAWTFATLYNTVEPRSDWLEAAGSCLAFLENARLRDGREAVLQRDTRGEAAAHAALCVQRGLCRHRPCGLCEGHGR